MIVSALPLENRFITHTDWEGYNRFLEAVGNRRIRVTYDGTMVELMTPSNRHEHLKLVLRNFLVCYLEERDLEFHSGGSTTFKRALKGQGLEPDDCYWIAAWRQVMGGWDSESGPPPDLAIEVEVSRSVLDRLSIYAALAIPELWRVSEAGVVSIWRLGPDGYMPSPTSSSLPDIPLELINEHLAKVGEVSELRLLRSFRQALRKSEW